MTILEQMIIYSSPILTMIVGFFLGRRKKNLENDSIETANVGENLSIYQKMLDDLGTRIDEQKSDFTEMLNLQKSEFETKIASQKKYFTNKISSLKSELEKCKEKYK